MFFCSSLHRQRSRSPTALLHHGAKARCVLRVLLPSSLAYVFCFGSNAVEDFRWTRSGPSTFYSRHVGNVLTRIFSRPFGRKDVRPSSSFVEERFLRRLRLPKNSAVRVHCSVLRRLIRAN